MCGGFLWDALKAAKIGRDQRRVKATHYKWLEVTQNSVVNHGCTILTPFITFWDIPMIFDLIILENILFFYIFISIFTYFELLQIFQVKIKHAIKFYMKFYYRITIAKILTTFFWR